MKDWGRIRLERIEDGEDFWHLFFEMVNDKSEFLNNQISFVEAYRKGNLYGLRVVETDEMYKRGAAIDSIFCDSIFCNNSLYLLPCFCIKENDTVIIIWTHTRARRNGFATKLVELLNIKYAFKPLPNSIGFWEKFPRITRIHKL